MLFPVIAVTVSLGASFAAGGIAQICANLLEILEHRLVQGGAKVRANKSLHEIATWRYEVAVACAYVAVQRGEDLCQLRSHPH